jgi:hypothetical protein
MKLSMGAIGFAALSKGEQNTGQVTSPAAPNGAVLAGPPTAIAGIIDDLVMVTVHAIGTKDATPGSLQVNLVVGGTGAVNFSGQATPSWSSGAVVPAGGIWGFAATLVGRMTAPGSPTFALNLVESAGNVNIAAGVTVRMIRGA